MLSTEFYVPEDKMRDLIKDNSLLLMVMSRFGISLGFADKTVKEVCYAHNVDLMTFITVANFISHKKYRSNAISLQSLMEYLQHAHRYFLDFNLPAIKRKLIEALDCSGSDDVALLILKFYDEYVTEVRKHMQHENKTVFKYVADLLKGVTNEKYNISIFESHHNHIGLKLKELKEIIIRYYPQQENDLLNSVLFDIINCEDDLLSHFLIENEIFIPAVKKLEATVVNSVSSKETNSEVNNKEEKLDTLSAREKEIIGCIAKGMSNKEIADKLNLSINTVTTHRRNIAGKLHIHSPAGLTIFAIVNKIVTINDIKI